MKSHSLTSVLVKELHLPKAKVSAMQTKVVDAIVKTLLSGETVTVPGLCRLELRTRGAHTGRNPFTKSAVEVPERRFVKVRTAISLNKKINGR